MTKWENTFLFTQEKWEFTFISKYIVLDENQFAYMLVYPCKESNKEKNKKVNPDN